MVMGTIDKSGLDEALLLQVGGLLGVVLPGFLFHQIGEIQMVFFMRYAKGIIRVGLSISGLEHFLGCMETKFSFVA